MQDKRIECGCHWNCTTRPHGCDNACIWPDCLTDLETLELMMEIEEED